MQSASVEHLSKESNKSIATLDVALARRAATLERRAAASGAKPKSDGKKPKPLTKALETRVDKHYGGRAELLRATSSSTQIEAFGRERFFASYLRMQDVKPSDYLNIDGLTPDEITKLNNIDTKAKAERHAAFLNRLWRESPGESKKRFESNFSQPKNYVIPRFTITSSGEIDFGADAAIKCSSVEMCILCPELLPDEFVERLMGVKFTDDESNNPALRVIRKAALDITDGVKSWWDHGISLTGSEHRLRLLQRPPAQEAIEHRQRYQHAPEPREGLHGTILLSREAPQRTPDPTAKLAGQLGPLEAIPRQVSLYDSIYGVLRKSDHQRLGYNVELDTVAFAIASLERITSRIKQEWREDASQATKDDIRADLRTSADAVLKMLQRDIDHRKRGAYWRVDLCKECRDCLNRLNPTSTKAQLNVAIQDLSERFGEIAVIGNFNDSDRYQIAKRIAAQEQVLFAVVRNLERTWSLPDTNDKAPLLRRALASGETQLSSVNSRPLSTFAGILRHQRIAAYRAAQADPALSTGATTTAMRALLVTGKLLDTCIKVERIMSLLIVPDSVPFGRLKLDFASIAKGFPIKDLEQSTNGLRVSEKLKILEREVNEILLKFPISAKNRADFKKWTEELKGILDPLIIEDLAFSLAMGRSFLNAE